MQSHNFGSMVRAAGWGALIGGGIGFVLGIVLAPEEGSRMRRRISYRLESLASQVGSVAEMVTRGAERDHVGGHSEAVVADARERAQEINTRMDEILDEASGRVPSTNKTEETEG